jgi:hypothetical protein
MGSSFGDCTSSESSIRGYDPEVKPQLAALGLVRQLPTLSELDGRGVRRRCRRCGVAALHPALAQGPAHRRQAIGRPPRSGLLGPAVRLPRHASRASGARLDRLEVLTYPSISKIIG